MDKITALPVELQSLLISQHHLVKSNYWSIINAAFWLVELLLGYVLEPTSSEKHELFGCKKGLKSSFN